MPIRLRHWTQREWYNAGHHSHRAVGDFNDADSLLVSPNKLSLRRAPAWEAQVNFPAGFSTAECAVYDYANQRVVFVGVDGSSQLAACYADVTTDPWTMSSVTTLVASAINPGGVVRQNCFYWGGDFWVIASNGNVYRDTSYTGAITSFYTGANAQVLGPYADRMYMATTTGAIYRLNDADSAFELYASSVAVMNIRGILGFKGQLLLSELTQEGDILLHRLPVEASNPKLTTIARIHASRGDEQLSGFVGTSFRALTPDLIYFSTGRDKLLDGSNGINVYAFNGTSLDHITSYSFTNSSLTYYGLMAWRDQVIAYELATGSQVFKCLAGDGWTSGIPALSEGTLPGYFNLFAPGGELILLTKSGSDEGIRYLSHDTLSDGYVVTPYLDMQQPSRQKRLEAISVLMDGRTASFKVPIKYRTDDTAAWTTAGQGNNTLRPTVTGLAETFYTLQVRVDLDDDTGANHDHRIHAIDVLYSIDT